MNKTYQWNLNSWGSGDVPENAIDIINRANELITAYAETTDDEEAVHDYSERLWDTYCSTGKLPEKKWDLRFTSDGRVSAMTRGFFEKMNRLSLRPRSGADYVEIGLWRFDKTSITNDNQRKEMRRFFQSVGLADQFDELISEEVPTTATVYADGPFNYEINGKRAVEAAAEFQERYDKLMRNNYNAPSEYVLQDLSDLRKEIAQKYNVEIH